eukprot:CAMPEP_0168741162 /NCGR_PEP_ID=MMETSP0724-20121128/12363_1 /TAXON_ID=265536 /ORGANISM="Amphiprora sp., Strain CCMP467" /LENGTH=141 /DNA_ID=CAMNT_0008788641 /DNA_START=30 /DNA_END=455 /DNA_ORIENTATION=-
MATASSATMIRVRGAGMASVNGIYHAQPHSRGPAGFAKTCDKMGWPSRATWTKLAVPSLDWYEANNGSYIYLHQEGQWWIDDPSGAGIYIADNHKNNNHHKNNNNDNKPLPLNPSSEWKPLGPGTLPLPSVELLVDETTEL